jgi:hypothetical protein
MSYTDIVVAGDHLVAQRQDQVRTFRVDWASHTAGWARFVGGGPAYKIHRRGRTGHVFIGHYRVLGRV